MFRSQPCDYLPLRVAFYVKDLKYATLATVSRCGMVWFSDDVVSTDMIFSNYLAKLRHISLEDGEEPVASGMFQVQVKSAGDGVVVEILLFLV